MKKNKTKSFQDNVYGNFTYPDRFEDIIKSKPVQRLFRIKQLGLLEKVYPGGDGNRFSHSLGVMFLMGEFIEILWKRDGLRLFPKPKKLKNKIKYWKDVARLCGLMHDLGHGPFSHSFESISKYDHEEWTIGILSYFYKKSEWTKDKIYKKLQDVVRIFKQTYFEGRYRINIPKKNPDKWFFCLICNLLSGPFDLDKLDYLMRDSIHLGFGYNKLDYDWLKQKIHYKFGLKDKKKKPFIYFEEDACTALDEFIFLRITYYWKCIFHRTVCLYDSLLKKIVNFVIMEKIHKSSKMRYKEIFAYIKSPNEKVKGLTIKDIEAYLNFDDCYFWEFLKYLNKEANSKKSQLLKEGYQKKIIRDLTNPFLTQFNKFDCIYEISAGIDQMNPENVDKIHKEIDGWLNNSKELKKRKVNIYKNYLHFFFFWSEANLEGHIKKEGKDVMIIKKQKNIEDKNDFFSLLEKSKISQLFIKGNRTRHYYIYNFSDRAINRIIEKILKIKFINP